MIVQDIGNDTLYVRYREGKELKTDLVKFKPYYWDYNITKNENYVVNYDGQKVYKHEYNNSRSRFYRKDKGITFETDVSLENRYLIDTYDTLPEYEPRVMHLDIETLMSLDTVFVPQPITAITLWDSFTNHYYTFSWKKNNTLDLSNENWTVTITETEKEMVNEFVKVFVELDPDLITGWNVTNFDIPYIINRMYHLGIDPSVLSPVGEVEA